MAAGETTLANGAIAYQPKSAPSGALPLIVLLHGAGGDPQPLLRKMEPEADRRGVILLAPRSLGVTWDFIGNFVAEHDPWSGPDAGRIDQSLADLFARAEVDPTRIVLLGFSDGASYALSLGLPNGRLFTSVVAFSPGVFVPPRSAAPQQRVFVAHGQRDRILSFDSTSRTIVPALRGLHVIVRFRPFGGDHEIDRKVLDEALDFALGTARPQSL